MKRYINIMGLLCCLFFWNSCMDEDDVNRVEEGIPVDVKFMLTSPEMQQVRTKADMGVVAENTVNDLQVFVFKSSGSLEKSYSFSPNDLKQTGGSKNKGGVILALPGLTSGDNKKIIAIANLTSDDIQYNLGNIRDLSDLKKVVVSLKDKLLQRPGGLFVMSGYYGTDVENSLKNEGSCSIDSKDAVNGIVSLKGELYLRHLDAKIKFNVKVAGKNKEFVPKDWKVVNVPMKSYLLPDKADASEALSTDFFTQEQASRFEIMDLNEDARYQGGSFVFYMNENRKEAENWPAGSSDYNLREYKTDKGGGPDVPFKYADNRSTYVIVRGSFYEYDDTNKKLLVSADVSYMIHLGYLKSIASDFNSERNKSYIYNVTIENVKNVILEVESSEEGYDGGFQEKQPGAEGDVIMSDQNLLLDAHYEVKSITFYKDKLDNLSVMVRTPYESASSTAGVYKIDRYNGAVTDSLKDFEWVELAKTGTNSGYMSYKSAYGNRKLQNVKEVLLDLYNNKDKDTNFWESHDGKKMATYTVFVNEYYYDKDPLTNEPTSWKKFVNAENRQMHILCDTKYSLDEQSSLTKSNIMINQRSIKSIYNVENTSLKTAWGIETVEETGRYKSYMLEKNKVFTNTKTNGRYNMFKFLETPYNVSKNWSSYIKFSENTFSPGSDSNKYAEYICLHRNRDLNGNGKIDDSEIRWYLPATNQYIGLWIGQDALPAEARLLQATVSNINESNRFNYHLMSSNGTRFWTEEGVSTGNTSGGNSFRVRCARNLGKTNDKPTGETDEPQDYVDVTRNGDYVSSVDLSRVSPLALRTISYKSISFHTEHGGGDLNYAFKGGFVVDSETREGVFKYDKDRDSGTLKGCPDGYRVPNQRELALIGGYSNNHFGIVDGAYKRLASCTYSALTYKKDIYLLGYLAGENINFLTLSGNETKYVRCVKDKL